MVIVAVRWFIKPEAAAEFREWWANEAQPSSSKEMFGEFLSTPVPAEEFEYLVDDLHPESEEYLPFVNIGLWRDALAFSRVIHPNDNRDLMPFEVRLPIRTILEAAEVHMGSWTDIAHGG